MQVQTIALASTQVFQPIWSRAAPQSSALASHDSQDLPDDATLPSLTLSADAAAAAPAQTPQKGYLLRAASPLLEEMLESPVTASKPAPEAASGSPGHHASHQDAPPSSNSRLQQGPLPSPLPYTMSPTYGNHAISTKGLPALDSAASTDTSRQAVPQTLSKDAVSKCSMLGNAADASGVTAVTRADTCSDLSLPHPDTRLQGDADAVSSYSESQGKAAGGVGCSGGITGVTACCCCEPVASAASTPLGLDYLPSNAQAVTGAKAAAESSGGCLEAEAEDTAEPKSAQQQSGKYLHSNCASQHKPMFAS